MSQRALLTAIGLLVVSCGDTGRARVTVPLYVAGTETEGPILAVDDVPVELDRADLAFGPLYLCAGTQAGELCDTARLEWTESVVVDALDARPTPAGHLVGVTGAVRSFMYDLGLSSQYTRETGPLVMPAARELGGVSLRMSGRAVVGERIVPFEAAVAIQQTGDTELGIPVIRVTARSAHVVTESEAGLLVRFDPRPWVRGIRFAELVESDAMPVPPESQAYRSVRTQLEAGPRPELEWGYTP